MVTSIEAAKVRGMVVLGVTVVISRNQYTALQSVADLLSNEPDKQRHYETPEEFEATFSSVMPEFYKSDLQPLAMALLVKFHKGTACFFRVTTDTSQEYNFTSCLVTVTAFGRPN